MIESNNREPFFREIQHFRQTRIMAFLGPIMLLAFFLLGLIMLKQLFLSHSLYGKSLSHLAPGIVGVFLSIIGVGICFFVFYVMKMETTVQNDGLYIRFYPLIRRMIRFDDIKRSEVRTYKPVREYGGWGIRGGLGKAGGAYNVSGSRGVQLELTNGKRLLIGSQQPEQLALAIETQMKQHRSLPPIVA